MGWIILGSLIVIPLAIWGIVNPRSQWQTLSAWQYRHPEANEPSDAAYALARFGSLLSLGAWIVMLVMVVDLANDAQQPRAAASSSSYGATRTIPRVPRPVELGALPVAGYYRSASDRSIGIVVRTGTNPWFCRPVGRVVAENARQVEVAAVLEVTPLGDDDPNDQCSRATDTPVSVRALLKQPLGKRTVVTRGPSVDAAGRIQTAGPVRILRVVPKAP